MSRFPLPESQQSQLRGALLSLQASRSAGLRMLGCLKLRQHKSPAFGGAFVVWPGDGSATFIEDRPAFPLVGVVLLSAHRVSIRPPG